MPGGLGRIAEDRVTNLTAMLDAFFSSTGYHMNVNVLNRETLLDAVDHPEKYPNLTIRVSGYAVNFVRLTREQQMDMNQPHVPTEEIAMPEGRAVPQTPLEAKSPFELRVNLGKDVPESDVRTALANGDMGFLHSFTTGSTVDGPGVRVVAWTTGCMWRCQYLHNPDTWTMSNGQPVTVAKAAEELGKYRHGLKVMAGGFTLSGGEPLMQHRFAVKLFTAARAMGIHTTVETNGSYGDHLADAELQGGNRPRDARHQERQSDRRLRLTGMGIGPTLEFAKRLAANRRPVWVRFVLVPGLTDDYDDIAKIADFAAGLGNVERVDVLPFHQMGRFKWTKLNVPYTLQDVEPPSAEAVEQACAVFRVAGLKAY